MTFSLPRAIGAIAAVWLLALGIARWAHHATPTAEVVAATMRQQPHNLKRVESQLNDLPYAERQKIQRKPEMRQFFTQLTAAEKAAFLDATLPAGFKQMMEAFNKMEPARRKAFVARALTDMQKHEGEGRPFDEDPLAQRVVDQGLRSFYQDASADTKLDLAPLIEQMQHNLRGGATP